MDEANHPMHHVWTVLELVHCIFAYLQPEDLVSMACTARAFRLPALSHVWDEVDDDGISALLQIATDSGELMHVRWSRLEEYAGLIKRAILNSLPKRAREKLNRVLAMRPRRHQPMLPQLQSLHSHPTEPTDLLCTLHFMHEKLERFHLYLPMPADLFENPSGTEWHEPIQAALFRIETELPNLKHLKLIPPSTDLGLISKSFFSNFTQLATYIGNYDALTVDGILGLAQLSTLRVLDFTISLDTSLRSSFVDIRNDLDVPGFSTLEDLQLVQNIDVTLGILEIIQGPLRNLHCTIPQRMSTEDLQQLVKAIASFHATLTSLDISLFDVIPVDTDSGKWQDLVELLRCQKLTYLGVVYDMPGRLFEFTDADLFTIASKLPDLRELWICWTPRPEVKADEEDMGGGLLDESAVTLWGLAQMLQQHPMLDRIHLTSINTSDIHRAASTIEKVTRNVTISAQSMLVSSPSTVALFLDGWLPHCHLRLMEPGDNDDWDVQTSDNSRQVTLIMALVELLRCHAHLATSSIDFRDLKIPEAAMNLGTLLE
ncbi:hypothetical protein CALVIDRAFT_560857 [Calocera viscosa TUFC12733]|uniref:F-box domain-containing protein n=1 Tax=Calocera viscosa (strain TUFC12733) TaxID=1330018 RepID=A0A167QV47_CALVF|nr:hypothetical protein CALVIDRAFT_560857 [Calocera viscosa TUFC12733]